MLDQLVEVIVLGSDRPRLAWQLTSEGPECLASFVVSQLSWLSVRHRREVSHHIGGLAVIVGLQ